MSSNTNIGNTPVNQGYVQLIHTGETGGIDGTLRTLYDGDGTASDLQIASNKVKVSTELYIGSKTATEFIQDIVGDMFTTGSYTNITTTYDDTNGNIDLNASGDVTLSNTVTLSNKTLAAPTLTGTTQGASITLSGDLTVNGTTTTVNQTNLDVSDNIIGLNRGAGSNANDSGLIIERGSTGDNAAIIWDESADKFTLGTTTSTPSATGNLTISTGTLVANVEGNVSGNLTTDSVTISTIQTGSESFADNDTSLMTSAAIQDKITSYGYVTSSGISFDGSTANGVLTFKDSDEATVESTLTFDGTDLKLLGDDLEMRWGAGQDFKIYVSSDDAYLVNVREDKDIRFMVNDGNGTSGANITALKIDASEVGRVKLPNDNQRLTIGASDDLQLLHNGTNSYIANYVGDLVIENHEADKDIIFYNDDGSGGTATYITLDGSATLTKFHKDTKHTDNVKANFGDSSDLQIYHDTSNSYITNATGDLVIRNDANDKDILFQTDNNFGDTTNYIQLDGSAKFTHLLTDTALAATKKLYLDGGGDTYLHENIGDSVFMRVGDVDMMRWYETSSTGYVYCPDNVRLGVGSGIDFTIRHDTSHTYITNTTGDMNFVEADAGNMNFRNVSGTSHLYIKTGGNVGIGTTSPSVELHVKDASSHAQLRIETDSASHGAYLELEGSANKYQIYNVGGDLGIDEAGVATRLTIKDSTGNVGIGVSSPNSLLHIADGVLSIGTGHDLEISHNGTHNFIDLDNGNLYFRDDANNNILIIYREGNGVQLTEGDITIPGTSKLRLDGSTGGDTYITEVAANTIGFNTAGSERMRIDGSGNVLIGGTSASGHGFNLEVLNDHAYVQGPDGWNGTGDKAIVALGSAVSNESFGCGYVYGTGLVLSTYKPSGGGDFGSSTQNSLVITDTVGQAKFINDVVAFATSDKRLKENVKPLDNALEKINKINGVEFDWIDGKDEHGNNVHGNEGHDVGVIAQEIEEVLPEVVHTRDNGYKAVKYEKIVPLLIQAIKEQQKQIEELKNG